MPAAAEATGQALMLAVAGRGHRAAAEQPGLPATVHGWLRRAVALAGPASGQLKGTWDLAVFGHPGGLPFTAITQPWLRQAAMVRAAEGLPA